jgi:hypothetical protein
VTAILVVALTLIAVVILLVLLVSYGSKRPFID